MIFFFVEIHKLLVGIHCRAFDVDVLHIAQYYKMPIGEVAVNWTEIDGKNYQYTKDFKSEK